MRDDLTVGCVYLFDSDTLVEFEGQSQFGYVFREVHDPDVTWILHAEDVDRDIEPYDHHPE